MTIHEFINGIPKAELHVHIEGTFEPELMFEIAKRNAIEIPYKSVDEVRAAYDFSNLQDFLDIYYAGAGVLMHEQDFYDLTYTYLEKLAAQNVVHAELFFDPQTHTERGIAFETVINGIWNAMIDAKEKLSVSTKLILCFLRHLSEEKAIATFKESLEFRDRIIGYGLDSSEVGHPPSKFEKVFGMVREEGFLVVAHAGEEGPAEYIWEALNLLNIDRLDHGNRCLEDDQLVKELAERQIALTVCPLSNLKLQVVTDMNDHPLKEMMDKNLLVTVNSDDPAYFGGHVNENYSSCADHLALTKDDVYQLARNSFTGSFLTPAQKQEYLAEVDRFALSNGAAMPK